MKRTCVFVFAAVVFFQSAGISFAIPRGTPEYEKMKEYKRQQRELKNNPTARPQGQASGFWAREASRSGLAGTAAMFGGVLSSAIPLEKPNARRTQEPAKVA
jgi:hypothetical protein